MPTNIDTNIYPLDFQHSASPPCFTCPSSLAIAKNLNLEDRDLGETGKTAVNAHLETAEDGTRRLVLS